MRRIASKFGDAPEPLAALTAIAYGRGDTTEAERAWSQVPLTERDKYLDGAYLKTQLKWPPARLQYLCGTAAVMLLVVLHVGLLYIVQHVFANNACSGAQSARARMYH
eukprot:1459-Heterococcus_DN1.PRE.1